MKKIILLILLAFVEIKPQDTTKPFYFPYHTGDMWEYFFFEVGTTDYDTVQNFTIFDSTDSNGIIHVTQYARRINPIQPPLILHDTTRYWIDTVNDYVYARGGFGVGVDSVLIYKLNASKGEQWIQSRYGGRYGIARVEEKWEDILFGKVTTILRIRYYEAEDSTDTLGIMSYYADEIADGFGLTYRAYSEYAGEIHLIGALINDTLYGKITLSTKENESYLSSFINLYQNYPNPFNPSTTISYSLIKANNVTLKIYDVLGREVATLVDEFKSEGEYKVLFSAKGGSASGGDASSLASGIYIYHIQAGSSVRSKKMILIR